MVKIIKQYFPIFIKGFCMGGADIVPGISGGTIAFITGIYDTLIDSIKNINTKNIKLLVKKGQFSTFWKNVHGSFMLTLLIGILCAMLSLAKIIQYLLTHEKVLIHSFFLGLILASTYILSKHLNLKTKKTYISVLIGILVAYTINMLGIQHNDFGNWYIFISGSIAICAMILPGISGSFILILLGTYDTVIDALNNKDMTIISMFILGCLIGILSFSKLLSFLLNTYRNITLSVLTGFLVGSLEKLWPWKYTIEHRTSNSGKIIPIVETNILPSTPMEMLYAVGVFAIGLIGVLFVSKYAKR